MSSETKLRFAKVEVEEMLWAAPLLLNCSEHRVPRKDELATAELPDTLCLQHWLVCRLLPAVAEGLCETPPWIARRPTHFRGFENFRIVFPQPHVQDIWLTHGDTPSDLTVRPTNATRSGTTISSPFHSLYSSQYCAKTGLLVIGNL